ncbi:MAG: hypothetical protein WA755_03155 [Candidatus Acidiferrales bacterium]
MKLADLYAKTRDAMVAFELAAFEEKAGRSDEAIRWYTTAFERFRRADWKKRAEESLTRLGAPVPATREATPSPEASSSQGSLPYHVAASGEIIESAEPPEEHEAEIAVSSELQRVEESGEAAGSTAGDVQAAGVAAHKRRRRGRRGGRGRRRKGGAAAPALPAQTFAPRTDPARAFDKPPFAERDAAPARRIEREPETSHPMAPAASESPRWSPEIAAAPSLPSERVAHGRGAEPAIASRLAHLESSLRRLLGSQLHNLDEADEAPAGPGVFILTDSDLVTSYYVESCKTLRVAIGQLLRGARGTSRNHPGGSLRTRLAEHLGINETKVSDYLKKHCVVRWIQLDEEAAHFAHFVIGVLRTPLNDE